MKRISVLLLVCIASLSLTGFAQEKKKKASTQASTPKEEDIPVEYASPVMQDPPAKEEVFAYVQQAPSFPGGQDKMYAFLQKHKKYPQKEPDSGIEGRVFVGFIVKSDGSIENIEIKRSLSPSHDAEAIRVIKMMPKWIPAKQNGRDVNCRYTLPVDFYFLK